MKGLSLSEKLSALTNPEPALTVEEADDEVTGAKLTDKLEDDLDSDVEAGERSQLRVRADAGLEGDHRYRGKKGKRRKLDQDLAEHKGAELGHMFDFGSEDDEEDDEEDLADEESVSGEDIDEKENGFSFDSNTDFASYGDDSIEDDESDEDVEDEEVEDEDVEEDSEEEMNDTLTKIDGILTLPSSEVDPYVKGCAVVAQISTWDKLLEERILLQKMLTKVNTFPRTLDNFVDTSDPDYQARLKKTEKILKTILMKCGELKQNIERRSLEDSFSVEPPGPKCKLGEVSSWLEKLHQEKGDSRRESLSYWGDRTKKLGAAWDSLHTEPLQQVDQIMSNPARLVARTRVKRSELRVLGEGKEEGEAEEQGLDNNPNIFDDSDFYHHLLRELIERKTANSNGDSSGQQWLQIQKLRSKMKRKIDTKASKGRKIRYDVHAKLVNFMAPVYGREGMEENARNELFSSLFGSRKPT